MKASDIDRGLSLAALTTACGPFEPAGQQATIAAEPAWASYAKPGRSGPLYEAFQRERAVAEVAKKAAAHARQLAAYHRERVQQERLAGLRGVPRREGFQHFAGRRRYDYAERRTREAEGRRELRERHLVPTWQGFLEREAARGNEEALAALRGWRQRQDRLGAQLLRAADMGEARHVILPHLRPQVRRDGRVIYRVDDGGLVSDEAQHVRVSRVTAGVAFVALAVAHDRFGDRPLQVQGTEAFRCQVAQLAGIEGLGVTFADADLEQKRRGAQAERASTVDRGRGGMGAVSFQNRSGRDGGHER